ncbi:hypothetical protein FJ208_00055 [Candidatus Gribaldobacteria bacterium]|nr:hypothetical protein [Candidatus Gribaldobacteria bacterium]
MKTILFIDGRNFLDKMGFVLNKNGKKDVDFSAYDFSGLFAKVLTGMNIEKRVFYFGKLIRHPETTERLK